MNTYAGVGSRKTPSDILNIMTAVATKLESDGYHLRSGGAAGADSAFEKGVSNPANLSVYTTDTPLSATAMNSIDKFHPYPQRLSSNVRLLMARNYYQVHGMKSADTPINFLICWTPKYTLAEDKITHIDAAGGTGQAVRIAVAAGIQVFNLKDLSHYERIVNWLGRE